MGRDLPSKLGGDGGRGGGGGCLPTELGGLPTELGGLHSGRGGGGLPSEGDLHSSAVDMPSDGV